MSEASSIAIRVGAAARVADHHEYLTRAVPV